MITAEQFVIEANKGKAQTQALIALANKTTKENDTTLTDAVNRLKEGYGQGGGGDAYYDVFWDSYQENGTRVKYSYTFAGGGWNDETFKPKYDISVYNSVHMFTSSAITDVVASLERAGKKIDFTNDENNSYIFQYSSITRFPSYNSQKRTNFQYFLMSCLDLKEIETIVLKEDGSQTFGTYSFNNLPKLEEIRFTGVIGKSGLDLHWSTKLSKASIESVINALSTTTSGLTVTLSKAAVDKAFETAIGANDGSTSAEWLALRGTRSNWTISLA